jgi:hypothetical protein
MADLGDPNFHDLLVTIHAHPATVIMYHDLFLGLELPSEPQF